MNTLHRVNWWVAIINSSSEQQPCWYSGWLFWSKTGFCLPLWGAYHEIFPNPHIPNIILQLLPSLIFLVPIAKSSLQFYWLNCYHQQQYFSFHIFQIWHEAGNIEKFMQVASLFLLNIPMSSLKLNSLTILLLILINIGQGGKPGSEFYCMRMLTIQSKK